METNKGSWKGELSRKRGAKVIQTIRGEQWNGKY